jgi:hypothetical protein
MNLPANAVTEQSAMVSMIERAARDPAINIDKLERLITLQENAQERVAEQAFNMAMSDAQGEMGPIAADSNNPQTKSRYASYFALDKALRPIYSKHGFALSFGTGDVPQESYIRVLCYTSHRGGYTRTYHVDMPADGKGAKGGDVMTKTHATGSAMTYGQRYLLKMIFNIAIGSDDDGNAASPKSQTRVPSPSDTPARPEGPCLIKGGKDADAWAKLFMEAMLTSDSQAVVEQWREANQDPLSRLETASPEAASAVGAAFAKHLAFLRKTEPKKEDPISTGIQPRPAGIPDANGDPEPFLKWAGKRMEAITSAEELELIWTQEIDPAADGLMKPDFEALQAIYKHHEKRLGAD